jgi:hypothetical protein
LLQVVRMSAMSRSGGSATRILRQGPAKQTGYAGARRRLRRVGLTSKMSFRPRRGNGRPSSWVAAVASLSAGAHRPEGARRGGKEAAEVACADRDEGISEDQAPEEDLARQVESGQACPAACGAVASHSGRGLSAAKRSRRACRCSNKPRHTSRWSGGG